MTKSLKDFNGRMLLVGCGNMAGAMLGRWLKAGLDPAAVTIVDPFAAPRAGIAQFASLAEWLGAGGGAEWIMLGMKPQQLGDVATEPAEVVTGETHRVSDRKGGGEGKGGAVRVSLGVRRVIQKK